MKHTWTNNHSVTAIKDDPAISEDVEMLQPWHMRNSIFKVLSISLTVISGDIHWSFEFSEKPILKMI